ncbi:MAG: hypothetical protein J6Q82_01330 [Clostridia bacterium]|nr:hypothetical protein [Clostridia bacterium]
MTTVKLHLKTTALLLALLFLPFSLYSCQTKNTDLPFELLDVEESSAEKPLNLYRIVIPSTCSAHLFDAAKELGERLTEQTTIPSEVVYDTESVKATENTVELLLGNCDHPISRRTLSELRSDDFLCQANKDTVILGGVTESATLQALDRYYDELFIYATAYSLLPTSASFFHRAEYSIKSITVNGFDLFEYTIVYDDKSNLAPFAEILQESLHTDGGYALELCTADEFRGDRKQIYLTVDENEASDAFRILSNEHGITLCAADLFGLSVAIRHWNSLLLTPREDGHVRVVTEAKEIIQYPYTVHEIATLSLEESSSDLSQLTTLNQTVGRMRPSIVFLGAMSDLQRNAMKKMLSIDYTASEETNLLELDTNCRLVSDLSEQTSGSAKLYSIGTGNEAFLLLRLDHIPTLDFSKHLSHRTIPLLILIDTELKSSFAQPPHISDDRFEVEVFEIDGEGEGRRLFMLYAEHGCFDSIPFYTEGGYQSITVHRSSAFYATTP